MLNEEPSVVHYKELEPLTHKENSPILVRNIATKEFLVKKKYDISLLTNLERLKEINHPNLPRIFEIVTKEQDLWLYEEYIHGKNVNELLLQNQLTDTQLILELGKSVTEALMILHEKKIIHRDIKPSNVMVTNDGLVKLVDFDAIRFYDGSKENDTIHLGTIGFASPEQYGFAETDERSDLYSLGIVLNVCSVKAFPKEQLTTNPFLKELVIKATKMDPQNRYQTASEMHTVIVNQLNHLNDSTNSMQKTPSVKKYTTQFKDKKNSATPSFLSKFLSVVPGFRTGYYWKSIIAIVWYLIVLLAIVSSWTSGTWFDKVLATIDTNILVVLPTIIATNFMDIQSQIPFLSSKKIYHKIRGFLLAIIIWILLYSAFTSIATPFHSPEYLETRAQTK